MKLVRIENIHGPTDFFARAKFTYSCVAFFTILLWLLREICMWVSGYFTSSAVAARHHSPSVVARRPSSATDIRGLNVYVNFT